MNGDHECDEAGPVTYLGHHTRVHCSWCGRVVVFSLMMMFLPTVLGRHHYSREGYSIGHPGEIGEEGLLFWIVILSALFALIWNRNMWAPTTNSRLAQLRRRELLRNARADLYEMWETGRLDDVENVNELLEFEGEDPINPGILEEEALGWAKQQIELLRDDAEDEKVVRSVGLDTLDDYQTEAEDLFEAASRFTEGHSVRLWRSMILQLQDFKTMDRAELRMVVQKQFNGYVVQTRLPNEQQDILYNVCREFVSAHVPRPLGFRK